MVNSELVGYVRKTKHGNALKLNISAEAFERAKRYFSQDGKEYVALVMHLAKVKEIIDGSRDVTSICQITDEEE